MIILMCFRHYDIWNQRFTQTCSKKFAYCKRWTLRKLGNRAMSQANFQRNTAFFTIRLASTKHRLNDDEGIYSLAANVASGVGTCAGIAEPFKHLLIATTHSQFLELELWAPTGQYGILVNLVVVSIQSIFTSFHFSCAVLPNTKLT